jgi:succinoglycan biosynthesis protein ExoL
MRRLSECSASSELNEDRALSVIVFSHDLQDARFHKRLRIFADAGFSVRWFAYDRNRQTGAGNDILASMPGNVLGKAHDAQYAHRIIGMARSLARLLRPGVLPHKVDIIYCINLDNLLVAIMAKIIRRHQCRIVYEVADIQPVLLRRDAVGRILRTIERWCLKKTSLVVYTSESYLSEFLRKVQGYQGPSFFLENKIYPAPFQQAVHPDSAPGSPFRIGFFGQLKCRRTFEMIHQLAAAFPKKLRFILRGYPNDLLRPSFERLISTLPNIIYEGPYNYPSDLPMIYGSVDLCWGFDFCSPGANSKWTLANRLYEAGFFGIPILVEDNTAGGNYVLRTGSGWVFPNPLEESLSAFFSRIEAAEIQAKKDYTAQLDKNLFVLDSDLPRIRAKLRDLCSRQNI